jgi:8-oxo-dGTP diphosphatase
MIFKGIDEYVNIQSKVRYMVYNYLATDFSGEILQNPPEGELEWIHINEAIEYSMQPWFRRRFPYFFEKGTLEIHCKWDDIQGRETDAIIHKL